MTLTADGCWADYRTTADATHGRPCLFLDRDGVLIEDTGYPHDPGRIVFIPEVLACVGAARRAGFVTGIVSNQSGIGRGYFDWAAFAAMQAAIDAALLPFGGRLDFVLACPHHTDALEADLRASHPWRKPAPGMLVAVRAELGVDMALSVMIGDRSSDLEAAASAGVRHRVLLGGLTESLGPSAGGLNVTRSSLGQVIGVLLSNQTAPPPHADP